MHFNVCLFVLINKIPKVLCGVMNGHEFNGLIFYLTIENT